MKTEQRKQWLVYSEQNKQKISSMIWEGVKILAVVDKNVRSNMKNETIL